jgi:hypothetical protein
MVVNPDELSSSEVDKIKRVMGVKRVFMNGRFYKLEKSSAVYKLYLNSIYLY